MADIKALRALVVRLDAQGKTQPQITAALKPFKMNRVFVWKTLKRYRETGKIEDRPRSGRPRSKRTPAVIKAVREKIRRNPVRRQSDLAKSYGMCRRSMQSLLQDDLKVRSYRIRRVHLLSAASKKKRLDRCRHFLQRLNSGTMPNSIFSDEKMFVVEAKYNRQNDRILSADIASLPVEQKSALKRQKPAGVMV